MKKYDVIVIGTGQAGSPLAVALAKQGKRVAIAEGHKFGGSCVNYGCIPTKTMIASARVAYLARRGADFGVQTGPISIDFAKVMARKDERSNTSNQNVEKWVKGADGLDVYEVFASFEGKTADGFQVRLGDELAEAPTVYINTGTRPRLPTFDGVENINLLDNEKLLALKTLPEHLIVLGGSYIGLEFGQAFRRFGSQVSIIETSDSIISREDDDVRAEVHRFLTDEGLEIHMNTQVKAIAQVGDGSEGVEVTLHNTKDDTTRTIKGSHFLAAIGRTPNSDKLNLEAVGVETNDRGFIPVDDHLRTNVPGIFALGDINARGAFTHTSYQDYEIALDNVNGGTRSVADRTMAYALYTDPPLGRVGMSEKEVRKSGQKALMAVHPMIRIGRALEQDETYGMIKLLVDPDTERFLGATVLGYNGDDVIQILSYFMATKASYKVMEQALPVHPTIGEFLPTILGKLAPLEDE